MFLVEKFIYAFNYLIIIFRKVALPWSSMGIRLHLHCSRPMRCNCWRSVAPVLRSFAAGWRHCRRQWWSIWLNSTKRPSRWRLATAPTMFQWSKWRTLASELPVCILRRFQTCSCVLYYYLSFDFDHYCPKFCGKTCFRQSNGIFLWSSE